MQLHSFSLSGRFGRPKVTGMFSDTISVVKRGTTDEVDRCETGTVSWQAAR